MSAVHGTHEYPFNKSVKIILTIEGPAGAGKTSSCIQIQRLFSEFAFVDPDFLKVRSFNSQLEADWNPVALKFGPDWRRQLAYEVAMNWMTKLCQLERPIIFEACRTFGSWSILKEITEKHDYKLYRILLMPRLRDCLSRVHLRNLENRHYPLALDSVRESYSFYKKAKRNTQYYASFTSNDELIHKISRTTLKKR